MHVVFRSVTHAKRSLDYDTNAYSTDMLSEIRSQPVKKSPLKPPPYRYMPTSLTLQLHFPQSLFVYLFVVVVVVVFFFFFLCVCVCVCVLILHYLSNRLDDYLMK